MVPIVAGEMNTVKREFDHRDARASVRHWRCGGLRVYAQVRLAVSIDCLV
jgi:hypothetical protein